ncbi:MAG: NUDIX hydrolase [Variibacter sp.]
MVRIARLDLAFAPRAWPFAQERRADIERHFAAQRRANPALWNGRVLMMHAFEMEGDTLRGAYLETDFASFLAWRDWGFPDQDMRNCFGMAALRGSDGGFVLGVMGGQTANPGNVYFPAGTPDPSDIVDGRVDIARSVNRELLEETGLDADELDAEPGWHMVLAGPRIALMKMLTARDDAATLRRRILHHLASEREPELSDIVIARRPADLGDKVPDHVTAFLHHAWRLDRS